MCNMKCEDELYGLVKQTFSFYIKRRAKIYYSGNSVINKFRNKKCLKEFHCIFINHKMNLVYILFKLCLL